MKNLTRPLTQSCIALAMAAPVLAGAPQESGHLLIHSIDGSAPNVAPDPISFFMDDDEVEDDFYVMKSGAGFFARDLNANGTIDNGSEFIGGYSGDPFGDLAALDDNGDGWLDDADDPYHKLSIWGYDQNGDEMLFSLSDAGISQILLAFEDLEEGGIGMAYYGFEGSVGYFVSAVVTKPYEVAEVTDCEHGLPHGDCELSPVGWIGYKCKDEDDDCTNNKGKAGTCNSVETQNAIFCECTGSSLSPLLDNKWISVITAVLVLISGALALRTSSVASN